METHRILVVDDEQRNRKIIQKHLAKENYELVEAEDGKIALKLMESQDFSLVLLDIMMPDLNGYEVVKMIRGNEKYKFVKVVLVSGKAMLSERLEGYQVGADDYITKPFDGEELKAKVRVFVKLYELESRLHRVNKDLEKEVQFRVQQVMQKERMAFIGMHSAEIIHNLKNPAAIVYGTVHQLLKEAPEDSRLLRIKRGMDKLLEITATVLKSVRQGSDQEQAPVDVNQVIREEVDLLAMSPDFKYNVGKELDLVGEGVVLGFKSHFGQVINNILVNALHAVEGRENPSLVIKTYNEGQNFCIDIEDNGTGIPENIQSKIFEPLFTTKVSQSDEKQGTGLGLAYCRKMLESYGGSISFVSSPQGTKFTMRIPQKMQTEGRPTKAA